MVNIFNMYPENRKSMKDELDLMLKMVGLGASVQQVVQNYNIEHATFLKTKDIYNEAAKRKIEIEPKETSETFNFKITIDKLKSASQNNIVEIRKDSAGYMIACFIVFQPQLEWFEKYSDWRNIQSKPVWIVEWNQRTIYPFCPIDE